MAVSILPFDEQDVTPYTLVGPSAGEGVTLSPSTSLLRSALLSVVTGGDFGEGRSMPNQQPGVHILVFGGK
jgi:hypothetical protein